MLMRRGHKEAKTKLVEKKVSPNKKSLQRVSMNGARKKGSGQISLAKCDQGDDQEAM